MVGGLVGNITQVPWHVGIYKSNSGAFSYHCGGSIVNARLIISAMHCFWNVFEEKPYNASLFRVGAGKSLVDYNAVERLHDQRFEVERIIYDPGYFDYANNYVADVALLVLNKYIVFQSHIGPVCMPYGLQFEDKVIPAGWRGRVAGWGLTKSAGNVSEVLKILEIPVGDRNVCKKKTPSGFAPLITADKFCAGFFHANVRVCEGDSGGGFVLPEREYNRTVYYLRGIVSAGPKKENSCDSNQITTFTNFLYYEPMVSKYDVLNSPKLDTPDHLSTDNAGLFLFNSFFFKENNKDNFFLQPVVTSLKL